MSEERFNRLEDKVDRVDDKIDKVSLDVTEMRMDTKHQMETIRDHVTQDDKIVNHIKPLLPILEDLAEMVEDHKFQRQNRDKRNEKLKGLSLRIGVALGCLSLIGVVSKYWKKLASLFF